MRQPLVPCVLSQLQGHFPYRSAGLCVFRPERCWPEEDPKKETLLQSWGFLGQPTRLPPYLWSENADSEHSLEIDKYQSYERSQPIWRSQGMTLCCHDEPERGSCGEGWPQGRSTGCGCQQCPRPVGQPCRGQELWASCLPPPCLVLWHHPLWEPTWPDIACLSFSQLFCYRSI